MILGQGDSASSLLEKGDEDKNSGQEDPSSLQDEPPCADRRPFFHWLEKIIPKDLEIAQQFLKTPNKTDSEQSQDTEKDLLSSVPVPPRVLFDQPSADQRSSSGTADTQDDSRNSFHKKGVAVGNAWNAKGLQKCQQELWEDALACWEDALACWENALEVRLQILGEDHLDTANTLNNIGIAKSKLGLHADAIKALGRAQDIRKRQLGENHLEVAATLHNRGNVCLAAEDFLEAAKHFQQAKEIQEAQLGSEHIQVARESIAMGHAYSEAQMWKESLSAYHDAKSILTATLDEDDLEVSNLMEDIQDVQSELEGSL
jgi:tetratricopeptide (TPR) repeat protein